MILLYKGIRYMSKAPTRPSKAKSIDKPKFNFPPAKSGKTPIKLGKI